MNLNSESFVSDNSAYSTPNTTLVEDNANESFESSLTEDENAHLLDNVHCSGDRNSNVLETPKIVPTRTRVSSAGDGSDGEVINSVNINRLSGKTPIVNSAGGAKISSLHEHKDHESLKDPALAHSKIEGHTDENESRKKSGAGDTTVALEGESKRGRVQNEAGDSQDTGLPDTVTILRSPCGGTVYLVGTAHFSIESQEDVAKTISAVQPNIVMVELCKSRVNILELDEQTILEEAKNINLEKIRTTIAQNGVIHGAMYLLLLSMSAHLTQQLGMAPGGEFRRAFKEARQVPGCLVHLGDRPIQITLQRALASLSWWQKLRLTWHIIMSKEPISKEEVEKCKQRDLLEEMLAEMTGEFPALSEVFVKERDVFLTNSLQLAASPIPTPHTTTGYIPSKVVGVVGIGHVPGIVQHWGKVCEHDIPPIMSIPPPTMAGKVLKFTFKASLVGLVLWGCYKVLPLPALKISPTDTVRTVRDSVYQFVSKNP